jgi:L-ascorbate metabolism protein UlaG (beta-lactamase superfamily)
MSSESDVLYNGSATLTYIGHAAFLWTAPDGIRVLIDPYQDPDEGAAWFESGFPEVEADLVVSTHDHFDHNAVGSVAGDPAVLIGPGEYETPGIRVTAVAEVHAGKWVMPNSLVLIETGGVRYLHCGDNRFDITPEAAEAVGEVDVVMVPVDDSSHLLSDEEVWQLATIFSPRVIVPMHYLIPGIVTPESTLLGIDGWLISLPDGVRVKRLSGDEVTVHTTDLPDRKEVGQGIEVWAFDEARANA